MVLLLTIIGTKDVLTKYPGWFKMVRNAVSNINPVREDRAARVLVLVLNQQSATISLHFTRLAIAPGQRYCLQKVYQIYTKYSRV